MWKLIIQFGIQLAYLILKNKMEKNDKKKVQREEAIDMVKKGLKNNDNSLLTAGLTRAKKI